VYELNMSNQNILNDYLNKIKKEKVYHYLLTVCRDEKDKIQSIISFYSLKEAIEGYEMYQDAGFAKQYLIVSLYYPDGKVDTKTLRRNHAGDPSFVRQNYIDTVEALHTVKNKLNKEDYEELCMKIVTSFAKDNWRFDANRFLKQLEIDKEL
jgi:hypothetical protein